MTDQCLVPADANTGDNQLFNDRIQTLQDETGYLCSYMEGTSLVITKNFIRLIQDSHIHCPDMKAMEVTLTNIAIQADTYHFYVTKQSSDCKELLYMLTKSLDNGGLVDFHRKQGNYSRVTSTIDKWHQKFLDLKFKFHLTDTPLDIMLNNKKIFYYDNWIGGIVESASRLIVLLISSVILVKVFTSMGLIFWIITMFSRPSIDSRQRKSSINNDSLRVEGLKADSDSRDVHQRKANRGQQLSFEEANTKRLTSNRPQSDGRNVTSSSTTSVSDKLYRTVTIIVWFIVLCGLIDIAASWYPSKMSLSDLSRFNWYPDSTATLEKMRIDSDKVQSDVSRQIRSIEKLQSEANMYHDKSIQANVHEFVRNLMKGIRQAAKEVYEVNEASEKFSSEFRQAYKSIEAKAKKAGRLAEAKNLLVALNQTSEKHKRYHQSLQKLMSHQRNLLPELKEQTRKMQALVQNGDVMEIGHIVNDHIDILMNIDGYTLNVSIVLKQLINILGKDGTAGMKKTIEELKDKTINDQFQAKVYGTLGVLGGSLGGTVSGLIALKSGYAVVSITATAVAGPIAAAVGGVGFFGFAAYFVATNFKKYNDASRYSTELDILQALRENFHTKMKNLEKAVIDQQDAANRTETALSNIATLSASFSNNPSFILPTEVRTALSEELLRIMQEYNIMISVLNSFETYMIDNDHELLSE